MFAAHRTGAGAKRPCSGDGAVMAAETMETKQALVRLLDRAIRKAKPRKRYKMPARPPQPRTFWIRPER